MVGSGKWRETARGATFAVLDGDGLRTWGEERLAGQPGARFPLYSLTKPLIAALLLRLGAPLDTPLDEHLPGAGAATLREVLSHTAGLPDYGARPDYQAALRAHPRQPWRREQFLALTPLGVPAQPFAYSNLGYLRARQRAEVLGGADLGTLLDAQFFQPLGGHTLGWLETAADLDGLTPGYSRTWGEWSDVRAHYHPGWVAHGTAAGSAGDIARLFGALLNGPLLSPAQRDQLLVSVPVNTAYSAFGQPGYGLGLMLDRTPGVRLAGHGGGGPGYALGVLWNGRQVGVACLNSDEAGDGVLLVRTFLEPGTPGMV